MQNWIMPKLFCLILSSLAYTIYTVAALECYDGISIPKYGLKLKVKECDEGQVCSYSNVTASGSGFSYNVITVHWGSCVFPYECKDMTCATVTKHITPLITVTSCTVVCCNTPLCTSSSKITFAQQTTDDEMTTAISYVTSTPIVVYNSQTVPEKTHSRKIPAKNVSQALQCHSGLEIASSNLTMKPVQCKANEMCSLVTVLEGTGVQMGVTVGSCQSRDSCKSLSCNEISKRVISQHQDYQVTKCEVICCESNLCRTSKQSKILNFGAVANVTTNPPEVTTGGGQMANPAITTITTTFTFAFITIYYLF